MQESNKLFYLGREGGADTLYKSKDLTTHALIIGMTGSGKTGLGIGLIEEAALDAIPAIVIDPKGDMGNLLLTFPHLAAEDFLPWIDPSEAASKNQSVEEAAKSEAKLWADGLKEWGQDVSRIKALKNGAEFSIYTPGASHGRRINILSGLKAPSSELANDTDALNSMIASSTASILNLIGINSDPLSSKEHILVSTIIAHFYKRAQDCEMEALIAAIINPPFEKVGVFSTEAFMPKDKRMETAMKLNAIVANISFSTWLEGEDIDIDRLLFTEERKARVSIFNIAHLNDSERMFFVTVLLNNIVAWMRLQEGSPSLRAILYMDEIFGFFPPNGNPPSKTPMLTLLKQARAFGLGVILATQNPVDLDYKGLSNIGAWFIGRLQTAQDKDRVLDGLIGLNGATVNKSELGAAISGLKKRNFLLKNVNQDGLVVFQTRWTLSYLKGPLSRDQIKSLTQSNLSKNKTPLVNKVDTPLIPYMEQRFYYKTESDSYRLTPYLVCSAKAIFINAKLSIDLKTAVWAETAFAKGEQTEWRLMEAPAPLEAVARKNSSFDKISVFIDDQKRLNALKKEAIAYTGRAKKLCVLSAPALKMEARQEENEDEFRWRIKRKLDELFEQESKGLKSIYEKKRKTLEDRRSRLALKLDKEKADARNKTLDTVVSIGGGILSALFSKGKLGSVAKAASGIKSAGKTIKEQNDVRLVERELFELERETNNASNELEIKIQELKEKYDISKVDFEEIALYPKNTDIYDEDLFVLWKEK
ncbi:MAG: DUF87 domain-containing protein [Helicobacteraceae bacterium]|jgi:hypothetical protein|nr:DUF87 domain-containing protein [Helicobacteraceae bacterium]